ncbi:TPA: hypothetical protein NBO89_003924 [Escherichia coli]|nr:hypothetical protein [Escherichia coli]
MATKEENLNRLRQLAGLLGREADMSGSAADIAQRVSEWEEELAVSPETGRPVELTYRGMRVMVPSPLATAMIQHGTAEHA